MITVPKNQNKTQPQNQIQNQINIQPVIKILFYAPGTGFGTQIPNVPFTIAHTSAGDKEVNDAKKITNGFNIDHFFTNRVITDDRMIPGFITLVATKEDIKNPETEQVYSTENGGTAGHIYQRLIDYNIAVQKLNKTKPQNKQTPLYKIYTVIDDTNSTTNLSFLLEKMLSNGYRDNFFDVCVTASKGIDPLLTCINRYNLDTSLVLINGGAIGYMDVNLRMGSKVRAVVLTHGGKDARRIDQQRKNAFLNGNNTKLFIYSNKFDHHNQESLILGNTSTLNPSMKTKTNRNFSHSYLPALINSAYYVGKQNASVGQWNTVQPNANAANVANASNQQNADWDFLLSLFTKEIGFITVVDGLMIGGNKKNYCGCDGGNNGYDYPIPMNGGNGRNYCGCSGNTNNNGYDDFMFGGSKSNYCGCGSSVSSGFDYPIQNPVPINNNKTQLTFGKNSQNGGYVNTARLNCGCDSYNDNPFQDVYNNQYRLFGGNYTVTKDNINDHLYPSTDESPFSDIESSAEDTILDTINVNNNQTGGYMRNYDDNYIVGKSISHLRYQNNRSNYLALQGYMK